MVSYTAVAAPFLAVLIGLLIEDRRRWPQAVAIVALALAVVGSIRLHGREGEYPATRPLLERVEARWRPGDSFVLTLNGTVNASLEHYARRELPPRAPLLAPSEEALQRAVVGRGRAWVVTAKIPRAVYEGILPAGTRIASIEVFDAAAAPLQLTLVTARGA